MMLDALRDRQVRPDRIEGSVACALDDQHANHGQLSLSVRVYQMHLHRKRLAVDGMFAWGVKVVLDELICPVAYSQRVTLAVVHLYGVAVVDRISDVIVMNNAEARRCEFQRERIRRRPARRRDDVNGRLRTSAQALSEFRTDRSPVRGALIAFVMPDGIRAWRRRGCRRRPAGYRRAARARLGVRLAARDNADRKHG